MKSIAQRAKRSTKRQAQPKDEAPSSGIQRVVIIEPPRDVIPEHQSDSNAIYFLKRGQRRLDALLGYVIGVSDTDGEPIDMTQLRRYARQVRENLIAAEGEIFAFEERVEATCKLSGLRTPEEVVLATPALNEALDTYDWPRGISTPAVVSVATLLAEEARSGTVRCAERWRMRIGDVLKMHAGDREAPRTA